jgi:molecular chaperone DnaJ
VLSDGDRRAQYDRYGRVDLPPGGVDIGGLEDLFGDLFEGFFGGGRGRRGRARTGDDLRYDLEITLEEASQGLETRLQIPRLEVCETCRGSGAEPGSGKTRELLGVPAEDRDRSTSREPGGRRRSPTQGRI